MAGAVVAWKGARAVRRAFVAHAPDLSLLQCVDLLLDGLAAGRSSWPFANLVPSMHLSLGAVHVSCVHNPADGPSRGPVSISDKHFTVMFFSGFASVGTAVDCYALLMGTTHNLADLHGSQLRTLSSSM